MKVRIFSLALLATPLGALPSWTCHPEVRVEGLFVRPSSCELDFVIADERPFDLQDTPNYLPSGRSFSLRPDLDGGVRVSLGYTPPPSCWQARVVYTHVDIAERRAFKPTDGGGLWPTLLAPRYTSDTPLFAPVNSNELAGLAQGRGSSEYQALQLEAGEPLKLRYCLTWRPYAALQLAYIGNTLSGLYRGTEEPGEASARRFNARSEWSKECWGVGPLFGSDMRYAIGYGFGIGAHLQMGLMAGQTHETLDQKIRIEDTNGMAVTDQTAHVFNGYHLLVFPFFEGKIGINYLWRCRKQFNLLLEFGYDFISYINSLERFQFNDQRGTGQTMRHSFSLDGVYLQFNLQL